MNVDDVIPTVETALQAMLKRLAMEYLVKAFPPVGLAILNPIASLFVGIIVNAIIKSLDQNVYLLIVEHRAHSEEDALKKAQKAGDQKAIEDAMNNLIKLGKKK